MLLCVLSRWMVSASGVCMVYQSLHYRIMQVVVLSRLAKLGPKPYLSVAEEEELVSFLLKCATIGYPHTQQVIAIVQQIVNTTL